MEVFPWEVVDKIIDDIDINDEDDRKCAETYKILIWHLELNNEIVKKHPSGEVCLVTSTGYIDLCFFILLQTHQCMQRGFHYHYLRKRLIPENYIISSLFLKLL